jgi:hypothetical protein
MAGNNKPPLEPPDPQAASAPRPRLRWAGTGFVVGCVPSISASSLVALDKVDFSPSTTFATVVLLPIVGWLLGLIGYCVQALIERRTRIEEELATTLREIALEDARRGPVQAGQTHITTVNRLRKGGYRLTRSARGAPVKPSSPQGAREDNGPVAPGGNGRVSRRNPNRVHGRS